jgi:DNA-binding MarR family transcriptional regulator
VPAKTSAKGRRSPKDDQVDDLVTAVLTASRVLVAVSATSLAEVEDAVTLTQFRTLVVLDTRGPTSLNALAESLDVNASTVLRVIDKLLVGALVTRQENPNNRREVVLDVTTAGADLVREATERRRQAIAAIVRNIPGAQRDQLVQALRAFADAAGEPYATRNAGFPAW